jgi:hypothetical protein
MGFSFSGLSLVTAAPAELDTNVSVRQGEGGGLKGHDASFLNGKQAAGRKGDSSDSESDWNLALCACADTQTPQRKELPPQASPFSAVLTSAVGAPDSDSSSGGPDSLSIFASEELAVSNGAMDQRLTGLLGTLRGEAGAPALRNAREVLARLNFEGAAGGGTAEGNSPQASALLQSPETAPLPNSVADALKAIAPSRGVPAGEATAREVPSREDTTAVRKDVASSAAVSTSRDLVSSLTAAREQSDADAAISNGEGRAALENFAALPANGRGQAQTPVNGEMPAEMSSKRSQDSPAAVIGAAAGNPSTLERDLASIRKTSAEPNEKTAAGQQIEKRNSAGAKTQSLESTANAYVSAAPGTNSVTPETAATATAPTGVLRSNATALQQQQASGGMDVPAAATSEAQQAQPSEVAFQGELRLRGEGKAADTARANPQQGNLAGLTAAIRDAQSADSGASLRQQAEAKTTPQGLEGNRREVFRGSADLSGGGDSPLGQDHSGGSLDRGTQQTAPLQGAASSQTVSSLTPSAKPAAMPAAAHLDAIPETTTPETNQPARSLALKIQTEDRGAANVVLTDRGGQVHMTVRSSDPALAQSLRSDLGSLAGGLQQNGFDVKLWNPSSGSSTSDDSRADTLELSQDDTRGPRHRHSPDDAEQRDGRRGEWPEEID